MNTFIIIFGAFGSVLVLANAIPVSPGCSNDNDAKITAALNELKKFVGSHRQSADCSGGSYTDNLLITVRSFLSGASRGSLSFPANLVGEINKAIEDKSNDGLMGLLEAVISGLIASFKDSSAEAVISSLSNSDLDSEQNALVRKNICKALGLSKQDAQNGDVLAFIKFMLKGAFGLLVQYISATFISGIDGGVTGLLNGGVLDAVRGLAKGMIVGDKEHLVDLANSVLNV